MTPKAAVSSGGSENLGVSSDVDAPPPRAAEASHAGYTTAMLSAVRPPPSATRVAAYIVVRWCVGRAIYLDACGRDPELRRINLLLRKLARTGGVTAEVVRAEQRQVRTISWLQDIAFELVDDLLEEPSCRVGSPANHSIVEEELPERGGCTMLCEACKE